MPPKRVPKKRSAAAACSSSAASSSSPAAVASASPIRKLYRNLLECVFAFASFQGLCTLMRVSREWNVAVLTMPSIRAAVIREDLCWPATPADPLSCLTRSRLRRHVSELRSGMQQRDGSRHLYSVEGSRLLSVSSALPWMRSIVTHASTDHDVAPLCDALSQLTSIAHLSIVFWYSQKPVNLAFNRVVEVCGSLRSLQTLSLRLSSAPDLSVELLLSPLGGLTQLREFQLDWGSSPSPFAFRANPWPVNADSFTQGLKACAQMQTVVVANLPLKARHMEELLACWSLLSTLEMRGFPQLDSLRGFVACSPSLLKRLILSDVPLCHPVELEHLLSLRRMERLAIRNMQAHVPAVLKDPFCRGPRFPSLLFAEFYHGDGLHENEFAIFNR